MPAVELVGPETSRDKLLGIYLQVYKLHRLPGSPLGELAIVQEVLANVPDHHQRGGDLLKPGLNLALSLLAHGIGEGCTGKARWTGVLPKCKKLTSRHYLPWQPWKRKLEG